jgi:hypothetical protein
MLARDRAGRGARWRCFKGRTFGRMKSDGLASANARVKSEATGSVFTGEP